MSRLLKWVKQLFTRSFLIRLGVLVGLLAISGVIVLVSGVVPIKASSGHWAVTAWLLNFASSRSVSTHSIGIEVPSLDDPQLARLGGAQFASACQWCHGSPEEKRPRVSIRMTPTPPYLPNVLGQWDDAELFYILKHGIKFAGMPAWPCELRDDDIWPVVAFLKVLPTLDAAGYRQVVGKDMQPPSDIQPPFAQLLLQCATCHGFDGRGRAGEQVPILAGQREAYLYGALESYAAARRHSGIMEPVAARLTPEQMQMLSRYYASQLPPPTGVSREHDAARIAAGRRIAVEGRRINGTAIAACANCHQDESIDAANAEDARPRLQIPRLAGQSSSYLENQLRLFSKRQRGGTRYHRLMHPVADPLSEDDRAAVAAYFASLAPAGSERD